MLFAFSGFSDAAPIWISAAASAALIVGYAVYRWSSRPAQHSEQPARAAPGTGAATGTDPASLVSLRLQADDMAGEAIAADAQADADDTEFRGFARDHLRLRRKRTDIVDCSIFAPARIPSRQPFAIQALLHGQRDLIKAARIAAETSPGASRRGFATLKTPVVRGTSVDLYLESLDLEIAAPVQTVTWNGEPAGLTFEVTTLADAPQTIDAVLHVSSDGIPVGEIAFKLTQDTAKTPRLQPVGDAALKYMTAFISYSRKDFELVSLFAQGLAERDTTMRFDVTALEPGDDWAAEIARYVDEVDVFYLMWSEHAAKSEWVLKESELALAASRRSGGKRPRIKPVTLHQPAPRPPEPLRRFHFDSRWLAHRTAQKVGVFTSE